MIIWFYQLSCWIRICHGRQILELIFQALALHQMESISSDALYLSLRIPLLWLIHFINWVHLFDKLYSSSCITPYMYALYSILGNTFCTFFITFPVFLLWRTLHQLTDWSATHFTSEKIDILKGMFTLLNPVWNIVMTTLHKSRITHKLDDLLGLKRRNFELKFAATILHILTSVCIFSIQFFIHFLRYRKGEFV